MIVYIHGFNSSAQSHKARLLGEHLAGLNRSADYVCPSLPDRPAAAMAVLEGVLRDCDIARTTLIGSSLGGYYATGLAERYGTRAMLLNPAVRPYELLEPHLGRQQNLYTGMQYDFTAEHLAELAALEVERITPRRYLLLVTTGDEVLDYRQAVERYRGCRQIIVPGGDHGLSEFHRHLDAVLAFARC